MPDYSKFDRMAPQIIADLIHDFGLKDFQAAGVAGNGGGESAGFTDIVEDAAIARGWKGGTGWFQDTGPRRTAFEAWIRRKGWKADSYEANYSYLYRELITTERAALQALRQTTSLEQATDVFCRKFERPANPAASMPARIRWARRALEKYRANPPAPTRWPTDRPQPAPSPQPTPVPPMPAPVPPVAQPDPVLPPKPWYQSRVLIGALVGIALPYAARYVPGLAGVNVDTATNTIINAIDVLSPLIGGWLVVQGRLSTTRPIAGTQAAHNVAQAEATLRDRFAAAQAEVPAGYVPEGYAQPVPESWDQTRSLLSGRGLDDLDDLIQRAQRFVQVAQTLAPIVAPLVAAQQVLGEPKEPDPQM